MRELNKIDVKGGKLSFIQRIELGKILDSGMTDEVQLLKAFIKCLHGIDISLTDVNLAKFYVEYFNEICEGLTHWVNAEQKMLKYAPSAEELNAGINELGAKIGYLGTVKSLARNHGKSPDDVLNWDYGVVFSMLYADLEEFKYRERYRKILDNKSKR